MAEPGRWRILVAEREAREKRRVKRTRVWARRVSVDVLKLVYFGKFEDDRLVPVVSDDERRVIARIRAAFSG